MIIFSSSAYAYTCNGNQCTIGTESGVTINSSNTSSNAEVEIQQGATVTGAVSIQNITLNEVANKGTIQGGRGGINATNATINTINNQGVILTTGDGISNRSRSNIAMIDNQNNATISSRWAIHNDKGSTIATINNSGEITGTDNGIDNYGTITTLDNNDTISGGNRGISSVGTIATINNSGEITGTDNGIDNSGTITALNNNKGGIINSISNQRTITNLYNSGEITRILTNQGTIDTLNNSGTISNLTNGGTITQTLTNSGTISHLNNTGTLAGGIVNQNSGTMILTSTGNIGLTNDDLHIKNGNNTQKAITIENVSPTRFNKLKVDAGVKGGIFIKQITAQVERDGLTLEDLIEEQSVTFGSDCQNENCILGLDENGNESEFSVFVRNSSVILNDFYAKRGQAAGLTLDTSALSGFTFSQSLIANSRLRDIRINSILKEFSIKNFQTNFENSKESNLESLESYNLGKSEKYASLTQDMILSENAESTAQIWSDEDLLRELDDIFIANKSGGEYYTFIVPYFSYDSSDIGGGDIKGNTRGFLAGIQTPLKNDAGIVGGFFGYERADKSLSSPSFNGSLDINDTSFIMGVSYYNVLHRKGLVEYYLSGNAKLGRSQYEINRGYEGGEAKAKPKSIGYGIESKVGANIYNIYDNSVLSPEIGLAYQGTSMENYTLNYGSVKEHYYSEDTNFVDVITAIRWQRAANPTVKYNVSLGAYWNLYEDGKVRGITAGFPLNEELRSSDYFAFTNVGITYNILENMELSLNYNGILGDKTESHTGYVRLGIWW